MITTAVLIALLAGFIYMAVQIEPFIFDQTITCYCGKRRTYRHIIVDSIEIKRIAQTLSEACEVCQHRQGRKDSRIQGAEDSSLSDSSFTLHPSSFPGVSHARH